MTDTHKLVSEKDAILHRNIKDPMPLSSSWYLRKEGTGIYSPKFVYEKTITTISIETPTDQHPLFITLEMHLNQWI